MVRQPVLNISRMEVIVGGIFAYFLVCLCKEEIKVKIGGALRKRNTPMEKER